MLTNIDSFCLAMAEQFRAGLEIAKSEDDNLPVAMRNPHYCRNAVERDIDSFIVEAKKHFNYFNESAFRARIFN